MQARKPVGAACKLELDAPRSGDRKVHAKEPHPDLSRSGNTGNGGQRSLVEVVALLGALRVPAIYKHEAARSVQTWAAYSVNGQEERKSGHACIHTNTHARSSSSHTPACMRTHRSARTRTHTHTAFGHEKAA
eukprot:443770-Pelagomonas_calceolata.AAC.5